MAKKNTLWKEAPKPDLKTRARNLTVDILDVFLSLPEVMLDTLDRKEFYRQVHGYYKKRNLSVENISHWLHSFKQSGYIEVIEHEGQRSVRFTNKARLVIIDRMAEKISHEGKFYLVSFDIPETKRAKRNQFRRVLKRLDFRQVQKSLWVVNKNLGEYVELAAREYKVTEYVVYAAVTSIDIKTTLEEMFSSKSQKNTVNN